MKQTLLIALLLTAPLSADERLKDVACRSVHWGYEAPPATAFYNEVTIDRSADGTYFCVCGFNKGYFGLQQLGNGKKLLIFSVWDPGKGDDPNAVEAEDRVKLLHRDEAVRVGRFGGEGTGGQSFFDFDWQLGETYRLLVTARPITTQPDAPWTEYAGWFYVPQEKEWKHLVTFATRTGGATLKGGYSFVEDFRRNGESTRHARTARFGNGWFYTTERKWQPMNIGRFTADANPATNINAALRRGLFLLETGGDVANDDLPLRSRVELPPPTDAAPPEDLQKLIESFADTPDVE